MAIGNTGCGKSTMLNSLVYGSKALHEVKFQEMIDLKNCDDNARKKQRIKMRKVIEIKDEIK